MKFCRFIVFLLALLLFHGPVGADDWLADYHFLKNAPLPPEKWTVKILPLETHTDFSDAEKTIPRYCIGDEITARFVLANEGTEPLSTLVITYEQHQMLACGDAQVWHEEKEMNPEVREFWGRINGIPSRCDERIVTLAPGEERTFEWRLPVFWILPVRGDWDRLRTSFPSGITYKLLMPTFFIGNTGRYQLSYHLEYPEGWKDLLHQRGYEGNFFEGTIEGSFQFDLVPPSTERKKALLKEAKKILRDRNLQEYPLPFLQCYYVAPQELEKILLRSRNSVNHNRFYYVYRGLEMFDTPRATAAVEDFKTWKPSRFQKILPSVLKLRIQPQQYDPIAYYVVHVVSGRIQIGMIVFVLAITAMIIRRRRKKKQIHKSEPVK